jgi:hypothetical protein
MQEAEVSKKLSKYTVIQFNLHLQQMNHNDIINEAMDWKIVRSRVGSAQASFRTKSPIRLSFLPN